MDDFGDMFGPDESFADPGFMDAGSGGDASGMMSFGGLLPSVGGAATRIMGGAGNPGRLARGGGTIMLANGLKMSAQKLWAATKRFGPDLIGAATGIGAGSLISVLLDSGVMTRRRRRRGISSRDIRTTRRVCRFAHSLNAQLAHCGTRKRRS